MPETDLSIVIIGRNEEKNLENAIESIENLRSRLDCEVLFVDSASTDKSVHIATEHSCRVVRLQESDNLCASAARFVGTNLAIGRWVLYIDGDMEITQAFCQYIETFLQEQADNPGLAGVMGRYDNYYDDGTVRKNILRQDNQVSNAKCFGGGVMLLRSAVVSVGNWNPRIFSNEELELYTRLKQHGYHVKYVDIPMLRHHTRRYSKIEAAIGLLLSLVSGNKRYFGIGQIVRARLESRTLWSFIRYSPHPFVFMGAVLLGIVGMVVFPRATKLWTLVIILGCGFVTITKGFAFILVYASFIPQIIVGCFHYPAEWEPTYEEITQSVKGIYTPRTYIH